MKKSFMTRVLAVSLSAAMAFSMSSASNLMTASAASTVNLKTTFKTLKVKQTYKLTLKNNTLGWKITKVTTSNKSICTVYDKKASSVMLKGKGVGRAKIQVKVKTTKRKYPKNIKIMTCTANVKAADGPQTPVETALSATATAISTGQVRVDFNKAVDDASAASNFAVSGGVTVVKSEPNADKTSTTLTIEGAEAGKSYDLTISGMTVGGEAQAEVKTSFNTPASQGVETGYKLEITPADAIVQSDGQHQTRVEFKLVDNSGKTITDETAQIEFSASRGTFADSRVTLRSGVATVQYNAPYSNVNVPVGIQATVVESSKAEIVGTTGVGNLTLSPNPATMDEAVMITSASAGSADRITAYFNKDVSPDDFMTKGKPNKDAFNCQIRSGIDNTFTNDNTDQNLASVIAIKSVPNEPKALELLVSKPMTDNSNVSVTFQDKRNKNTVSNTVFFKLADAREPSVLDAKTTGTKTIDITFSEAVLGVGLPKTDNPGSYYAYNIENYLIDGKPLSQYGVTQAASGADSEGVSASAKDLDTASSKNDTAFQNQYNAKDGKVTLHACGVKDDAVDDRRNVVTITLGSGHPLTVGSHTLTVKNVGDWAANTDGARNSISTQIFQFDIADDPTAPNFTVDVQSPEQYELNFGSEIRIADSADTFTTPNSSGQESILKLQERINGAWTTISDNTGTRGRNPIRVSKVDEKKYIVETTVDWSEVYDYEGTRGHYYTRQLRLHVDAGKLVNATNNVRNNEINIELAPGDSVTNGEKMKNPDTDSPRIEKIDPATANGVKLDSWNVKFTEPLKLSDGSNGAGGANGEGLTPSQDQSRGINDANKGVPTPQARFINVDNPTTVVKGIITQERFIDAQDTTINVAPETALAAGDWNLVIDSISDDYGTTNPSEGKVITVDANTAATDFQVVWAAVANNASYPDAQIGNINPYTADGVSVQKNRGRFVFVKFSKPVDRATALDENNYALNNQPLPHGSYIQADINGYDNHDNVLDSVTIVLPGGSNLYNYYTVDSLNSVLSITGVVSANNEVLSNADMKRLPFNFGIGLAGTGNENNNWVGTGNGAYVDSVRPAYDAVWGNAPGERSTLDGGTIAAGREYYQALKDALDNPQYRAIAITQNIDFDNADAREIFGRNRTLNINRAVDIDLGKYDISGNVIGKYEINGNVSVSTTDAVNSMTISNGKITGNVTEALGRNSATLTVNAGTIRDFILDDVDIEIGDNARYGISLSNVWTDSFVTTNGTSIEGDIYVSDADGFAFYNNYGRYEQGAVKADVNWPTQYSLVLNTNGIVNLKGDFRSRTINVNQAATVNLGTKDIADSERYTAANIEIDNAIIRVSAAEAKIMFSEGVQMADTAAAPTIIAAAKDVKVYAPEYFVGGISRQGVADKLLRDNGNFVSVDKNGRNSKPGEAWDELTDSSIGSDGMQKIFEDLDVIPGVGKYNATSYAYDSLNAYKAVSSGAILVDGELNVKELVSSCRESVVWMANHDSGYLMSNADGTAIGLNDISVSCRLNSGNKIFETVRGVIKPIANPTNPQSNDTDTITITLTYKGYSYVYTIKVTRG